MKTGIKLLNSKKQELEQKWHQAQYLYNNSDKEQLHKYMDSNRIWIPMIDVLWNHEYDILNINDVIYGNDDESSRNYYNW